VIFFIGGKERKEMNTITKNLTAIVSDVFEKCGYNKMLGDVSLSDRIDLCKFQCNGALTGAKIYKKSPMLLANEIAEHLKSNPVFTNINAVKPGFINIDISDGYLIQICSEFSQDVYVGIPQVKKPEIIFLDYGGPNIAKPLHIGHLRPAIIGEALKNLFKAAGNTVISDVHMGDWGLPIGLVIAELEERYIENFSILSNILTAELLNRIYPIASQKSKTDESFKHKAKKITAELQSGNEKYLSIWKDIIKVSIPDLKDIYDKLGVSFDLWNGESDADKYTDALLNVLNDKGILYESDGAMVVDVSDLTDKAPMPPVIIKKSDGSSNYATTDIATIFQRAVDFNPDKIWYVVDIRQTLHFMQIFRCAKKAEIIPDAIELIHLGFGTMNGKDGKPFKTRDGGVMPLSEFLQTVTDKAIDKLNSTNFLSDHEKYAAAKKLGIAAIKFGDMMNNRTKDYIFDIDKFLSFEGKTGIYLLYTITRINSILKKCEIPDDKYININHIYSDAERNLILSIVLCGEAFHHAIDEKALNYICESAFTIASAFSTFYHDNHIINELDLNKKNSWIDLCVLTKRSLKKHLDILGIETVDAM
jgi:arginyl-tRNA synthetase